MKRPFIGELLGGDQAAFLGMDQANKGAAPACQRRDEMGMHLPVDPVNQTVGVVDVSQVLRQEELHEAERETMLGRSIPMPTDGSLASRLNSTAFVITSIP